MKDQAAQQGQVDQGVLMDLVGPIGVPDQKDQAALWARADLWDRVVQVG
jgi:hypothetical protein